MSAFAFKVGSEGEIALSAATIKSVLHVTAPTNHRVKLLGWGIFFDGTSPTAEPVRVQLQRTSADGTFTSATPRKSDDSIAETIQSTAGKNASAEPATPGDILEVKEIHPQSGYEVFYPFGQEVVVGGGDRLCIRATAPASVNCEVYAYCEE
jgi:hypothetical protein